MTCFVGLEFLTTEHRHTAKNTRSTLAKLASCPCDRWQVSAPGRGSPDRVAIQPSVEPRPLASSQPKSQTVMNLLSQPYRPVVDLAASPSDGEILWHHPAFCRLALPLRAPRTAWQRTVEAASVTIEPGTAGHTLPAGELLRALLLFICDAAIRTGAPVIDLGDNAAALATRLGRPAHESAVRDQVERILAAIIAVSADGGSHRAIFDRRAVPRGAGRAWRASVRLNGSFFTGLIESAIPLNKAVVATLRDTPAVFDAYAWARQALHGRAPGHVVSATWGDLHAAFATASQDLKTFKPAFEAALQRAAEADPTLDLQVTPGEVGVAIATGDAAGRSDTPPAIGVMSLESAPPPSDAALSQLAERAGPAAEQQDEPEQEARSAPSQDDHAASLAERAAEHSGRIGPAPIPETVSLRPALTGLPQVIWLRRGYGVDSPLVGVTPGARFDADRLTLLAVEPLVVLVSGGLPKSDFDQIAAWITANRDLIDEIWSGHITSFDEINRLVRKAPPQAWG